MADYKELLRRAVQALPENNGQARRAVYEKARAALVGQLRAITPPLAARDITTHRLQLEDCIRQVEQEASEAVIAGMQEPAPPPPKVQTTQAPRLETRAPGKQQPAPSEPPHNPGSIEEIIAASEIMAPQPPAAKPAPAMKVVPKTDAARPESKPGAKPETPGPRPDIRIATKGDGKAIRPESKTDGKDESKPETKAPIRSNGRAGRPLPSIVARAEAAKGKPAGSSAFGIPPDKPYDGGRRGPTIEPRRESGTRLDASTRGPATARQVEPMAYEQPIVAAAMSAVREVDIEPAHGTETHVAVDPQGAIDRAIAALDREARGDAETPAAKANGHAGVTPKAEPEVEAEPEPPPVPAQVAGKRGVAAGAFRDQAARPEKEAPARTERDRKGRRPPPRRDVRGRRDATDGVFQRAAAESERGGVSALGIFLAVFVVLLLGVGGAGYWAWREGYLNLDSMFARSTPPVQQAVVSNAQPETAAVPPASTMVAAAPAPAPTAGPLNTATSEPELSLAAPPKADERLTPSDGNAEVADPMSQPLALAPTPNQEPPKTEERLPVDGQQTAEQTTDNPALKAIDPATMAGSQSLLLEASDTGTTGAVPFSGTVDWSRGKDETGAPTLVAKATIPARNLTVDLLIRKNSDQTLPASHLMEINFTVSETFIGGSVAGLPGVLLKNEELVQGTPLVGASARVVGNQFLFALSASAQDTATNIDLLTNRKWIDLAVIYATGKRAIITLEKDDAADKLFREVFAEWNKTASATPAQ